MAKIESTGSMVFDPATLSKALTSLTTAILSGKAWLPGYDESREMQLRFLFWYYSNLTAVEALTGLETEVSDNAKDLNRFLVSRGFEPLFHSMTRGEVGAVAVLDLLVQWATGASNTQLTVKCHGKWRKFQAYRFRIDRSGAEIFDVPDHPEKLFKLPTKDGGAVWLTMADRPRHEIDLVEMAVRAMGTCRPSSTLWISAVTIPDLRIKTRADLSWMIGLRNAGHEIAQAFQMIDFRMSCMGAHEAPGSASRGDAVIMPSRKITHPFVIWSTRPNSKVPIAPFYADYDTWKASEDL